MKKNFILVLLAIGFASKAVPKLANVNNEILSREQFEKIQLSSLNGNKVKIDNGGFFYLTVRVFGVANSQITGTDVIALMSNWIWFGKINGVSVVSLFGQVMIYENAGLMQCFWNVKPVNREVMNDILQKNVKVDSNAISNNKQVNPEKSNDKSLQSKEKGLSKKRKIGSNTDLKKTSKKSKLPQNEIGNNENAPAPTQQQNEVTDKQQKIIDGICKANKKDIVKWLGFLNIGDYEFGITYNADNDDVEELLLVNGIDFERYLMDKEISGEEFFNKLKKQKLNECEVKHNLTNEESAVLILLKKKFVDLIKDNIKNAKVSNVPQNSQTSQNLQQNVPQNTSTNNSSRFTPEEKIMIENISKANESKIVKYLNLFKVGDYKIGISGCYEDNEYDLMIIINGENLSDFLQSRGLEEDSLFDQMASKKVEDNQQNFGLNDREFGFLGRSKEDLKKYLENSISCANTRLERNQRENANANDDCTNLAWVELCAFGEYHLGIGCERKNLVINGMREIEFVNSKGWYISDLDNIYKEAFTCKEVKHSVNGEDCSITERDKKCFFERINNKIQEVKNREVQEHIYQQIVIHPHHAAWDEELVQGRYPSPPVSPRAAVAVDNKTNEEMTKDIVKANEHGFNKWLCLYKSCYGDKVVVSFVENNCTGKIELVIKFINSFNQNVTAYEFSGKVKFEDLGCMIEDVGEEKLTEGERALLFSYKGVVDKKIEVCKREEKALVDLCYNYNTVKLKNLWENLIFSGHKDISKEIKDFTPKYLEKRAKVCKNIVEFTDAPEYMLNKYQKHAFLCQMEKVGPNNRVDNYQCCIWFDGVCLNCKFSDNRIERYVCFDKLFYGVDENGTEMKHKGIVGTASFFNFRQVSLEGGKSIDNIAEYEWMPLEDLAKEYIIYLLEKINVCNKL